MADRPFRFATAMLSDIGCTRTLNEDACLSRAELGLWAVADGMGGHHAGDVASQAIVAALDDIAPPESAGAFLAEVQARLQAVHARLRAMAEEADSAAIGSTVVVLLAFDAHFACAWAGDSRLYLWRDRRLTQVSHDHSYVQELVDLGVITAEAARTHPRGNVITRAVGAGDVLDVEVCQGRLQPDDRFLLCSDGLNRMVEDAEIAAALEAASIDEVASHLMELSLSRGARDNVTLIIVECHAAD